MTQGHDGVRTTRTRCARLTQLLNDYRGANIWRSILEIVISIVPLVALWILMWLALGVGYGLYLLLAIPAAGFLLRLFMIQHDCGHGAFFRQRVANDWVGRVIGVLTLTPYDFWKRTHAVHHATSGNLDRRGHGRYRYADRARIPVAVAAGDGFAIRLYRNPAVMFGLGPAYLFLVQHRLPVGLMQGAGSRGSVPWQPMRRLRGVAAILIWLIGIWPFLLIHLPITLIAASIGVWLFYVQHQFEATFWAANEAWTVQEAALHGSSFYDLPGVLHWFTANIGVHHVHHLCSRIPFYRLPQALRANPELANIGRLTLWQSSVLRATGVVGRGEPEAHFVSRSAPPGSLNTQLSDRLECNGNVKSQLECWQLAYAYLLSRPLAGEFPDHPIRLIVSHPPSGYGDTVARIVAEGLAVAIRGDRGCGQPGQRFRHERRR